MKKNITLEDVKANLQIDEYIKRSTKFLELYHYTDHGMDHCSLVAERARYLAKEIGLSEKEQELASIASYVHDIGNFLDRQNHEYWGALLFHSIFQNEIPADDMATIMQAIATHDNYKAKIINAVAAVGMIADKSDVRRSRVTEKNKSQIAGDIHNRVNFGATGNKFEVDKKDKKITLILEIDTSFVPVMEYFEIFTYRMVQCRKAAQFLGYKFQLVINDFKLL
ncbi:MAG: HD domain-containing protein [Candidatus Parcubacteria bacterium]|nr:HD domain-containing protein [Candidatus Parcubacteria bacterium]